MVLIASVPGHCLSFTFHFCTYLKIQLGQHFGSYCIGSFSFKKLKLDRLTHTVFCLMNVSIKLQEYCLLVFANILYLCFRVCKCFRHTTSHVSGIGA